MGNIFRLLIPLLLLSTPVTAQTIKTFLVAGQSNARGWGYLDDLQSISHPLANEVPQVQIYFSSAQGTHLPKNQLYTLQSGTGVNYQRPTYRHVDRSSRTISRFGPELSFGKALHDELSSANTRIAIIKYTNGGTSLHRDWDVTPTAGVARAGNSYLGFQNTVLAGIAALEAANPGWNIEISGMIWWQGEGDRTLNKAVGNPAASYGSNLTDLIAEVRAAYGNIPFVYNEVADHQYRSPSSDPALAILKEQQASVERSVANTAMLDLDHPKYPVYSTGEGVIHFDSFAQLNAGNAYALKMIDLLVNTVTNSPASGDAQHKERSTKANFPYLWLYNRRVDPRVPVLLRRKIDAPTFFTDPVKDPRPDVLGAQSQLLLP